MRRLLTSFVMATHKKPVEAGEVLVNLAATLGEKLSECEIIVVGSTRSDKPTGDGLPDFKFILSKEDGGSKAFWLGIKEAQGEYVIWSCDDHEYHDPEWFDKYLAVRKVHPNIKLYCFNSMFPFHGVVPIGSLNREWYLKHYPEPVFGHYYWDAEMYDIATRENTLLTAFGIEITDRSRNHPHDHSWQFDGQLYRKRKQMQFRERKNKMTVHPYGVHTTITTPQPQPIRKITGIGDVIAMVAEPIARFSDKHFGTKIVGCGGCANRRKMLNKAVPFKSDKSAQDT